MKTKLNRKGFTLVELLATVVILLALSTVAITSISASIDRQNEKRDKAVEELIVSYGRLYIEERKNVTCVDVEELILTYGLDRKNLKKSDGSDFNGRVSNLTGPYKYDGSACS